MNTQYQTYGFILYLINSLHRNNSWCGETHIQKNIYIFQNIYENDICFNFILYKHGPYSFDLHDIVNDLYQYKFIYAKQIPPFGPRICITNEGEKYLLNIEINNLSNIDTITNKFGNTTVQYLEKMSTALLILKNNPHLSSVERSVILHTIKPHITIKDAEDATQNMDMIYSELHI